MTKEQIAEMVKEADEAFDLVGQHSCVCQTVINVKALAAEVERLQGLLRDIDNDRLCDLGSHRGKIREALK